MSVQDTLCTRVLGPLPRTDQRRWGRLYLRGLLSADGRKTMRNIASLVGRGTIEQNLHHFISKSSWSWRPLRQLLAQHVHEVLRPAAWVVDEMVIPKRGQHTVGVEHAFVPRLGRMARAQRSFGVWLVSEQAGCPVNWRLMLPPTWATGARRGTSTDIQESTDAESPGLCALHAVTEMLDGWSVPPAPVLMDARNADVDRLVAELTRRDAPFIVRIEHRIAAGAVEPAGSAAHSSGHYLDRLRGRRQPIGRRHLAATIAVTMRACPATWPGRPAALILLAEWSDRGAEPTALWLTNLRDRSVASLVRLTELSHRVAEDFAEIGNNVGIQDFEGRSFAGWHRHMTLASTAHAVIMTDRLLRCGPTPAPSSSQDTVRGAARTPV